MVQAIDVNDAVRFGVQHIIGEHIEVRLAASRRVLAKGNVHALAAKIVSAWPDDRVRVFWHLVRNPDEFHKKSKLAKAAGARPKAFASAWTRLTGITILARDADGASIEQTKVRLFRRGREMVYSADGIALKLNLSQQSWAMAKRVTDSTFEATMSAKDNYEGACESQEGADERGEEERNEARRKMVTSQSEEVVRGPQAGLFGTK